MKHARQKIREHVATLLDGIVGVTVFRSRVYPVVNMPVISVFANGERSESENKTIGAPRRYTRRLVLEIDVVVSAVTGSDDDADDYAAQAEALMAADTTLGGYATESELLSTTIELGAGETPTAKTRLSYEVWYRTTGSDPETAL